MVDGSLKQILSGMILSRGVRCVIICTGFQGHRKLNNADADVISDVLTRRKLPVIRTHHLLIVSPGGKLPQNIKCSLYGSSLLPNHKWKLNVQLTIIEIVRQPDSQTVSHQTILLRTENWEVQHFIKIIQKIKYPARVQVARTEQSSDIDWHSL